MKKKMSPKKNQKVDTSKSKKHPKGMTAFTRKKITPSKRVCLRLKEAREAAQLTIEQLAQKTHIDKRYLIALEECRFEELPEALVCRKGFIKQYLRAVGHEPDPFINQFLIEEAGDPQMLQTPKRTIRNTHFRNIPTLLKYGFVATIVLAVLSYLGLQVKHITEPASLTIISPQNGEITTDDTLVVRGYTEPEVQVRINGEDIVNDEEGDFETDIGLGIGINEIQITATKRHGKTTSETIHVILKETSQLSLQETDPKI